MSSNTPTSDPASEGPPSRTQRRKRQTRQKLIASFRKLAGEKGVDAVTIRDIAESADIALGGFYSYFESKELLYEEAVREIVYETGEIIDNMISSSNDPAQAVAIAITRLDFIIQQDRMTGWFLVRVAADKPEVLDSLMKRFLRDVRNGITAGRFTISDLSITLMMIHASLIAFIRRRLEGDLKDDAVPSAVELMMRLLGVPHPESQTVARRAWEDRQQFNNACNA